MRRFGSATAAALTLALITSACAADTGPSADVTTTLATETLLPTTTPDSGEASSTGNTEQPTTEGTIFLTDPPTKPLTGTYDSVFTPGEIDKGLASFISVAVTDLAEHLGIVSEDIEIVTATVVVWSDASLGCPEPDMLYAQVPTDGSLIELAANGEVYRYHSGGQRTPFLCEQPLKKPPATTDIDL